MSRAGFVGIVRLKLFGKSPVGAYLRLNQMLWRRLPLSATARRPLLSYGRFLHELVLLGASRRQYLGTFFFRNRAQLELIRRLSTHKANGSTLKICVVGCSNGAEVYSILWTLRSACPDITLTMTAVDISTAALDLARKATYTLGAPELVGEPIFERMTEAEMQAMFDKEGEHVKIKHWIREGALWHLGNAGDPELPRVLGPQDMVVANNFLCHMDSQDAEHCLRNIARLVIPGGYLFVSGVDLDVRTKVADGQGWKPVPDLMEDIHEGDPVLRRDWPFAWWGLEPLDRKRHDWELRYAAVFQIS